MGERPCFGGLCTYLRIANDLDWSADHTNPWRCAFPARNNVSIGMNADWTKRKDHTVKDLQPWPADWTKWAFSLYSWCCWVSSILTVVCLWRTPTVELGWQFVREKLVGGHHDDVVDLAWASNSKFFASSSKDSRRMGRLFMSTSHGSGWSWLP